MRYTLLVLTPPDLGSSARHAAGFCEALLSAGHEVDCVFFFDAGVLTLRGDCEAQQDERDLRADWSTLQTRHDLQLFACVASAARFGVSADAGAGAPSFTIAGLGELVEASERSDRLLTFRG